MKHRSLLAACAAVLFLCTAASCKKSAETLSDGTFIGTGSGRNGDIVVSVIVRDGVVADAAILSEAETPEIGSVAAQGILQEFVKVGSISDIDVVSGATLSSDGVLDALEDALSSAKGKKKPDVTYADTTCDIVIIGAGGAGLVAAAEAASKGASVIVLEKMGIVGGNTNSATGGINAAYTEEQKKLGIVDSADVFYSDTMKGGYNLNDSTLVRTLADKSAETVEWLMSPLIGADLSDVGIFGGSTNKRTHRPQGGQAIGAHLVPLLQKAAVREGADIRTNSKVVDILSDKAGCTATGVRVETAGSEYTIASKAVIIATGGFGANMDLVAHYNPALKGFLTTNHAGATGDAFAMVEKFNAALTDMDQIQTHPTVVPGSGHMISEAVRGNGAILVNHAGKRFVNEMETRDVVSAAILAEPEHTAFLVFDQGVRDSFKAIDSYAAQGLLTQAESISALAEKIGVPAAALEKTIATYNGFVASGADSDFSRTAVSLERALNTPPYYAAACAPAVHHTMGGLKINAQAQVLNTAGEPIKALYAAGEVTGGVHGGNRLGGNAIADICVFGKIAADSALTFIGK